MKRIAKIFRQALRLTALTLALTAVATVWLVSPPGVRWVARRVELAASRALQAEVRIEGAVLRWPLELHVGRVRIGSGSETHVEADTLAVRVSLRQALNRRLWVHHVRLSKLVVRSWPQTEREPAPSTGVVALPDLTRWLSLLTVTELRLERLQVEPPLAARAYAARATGFLAPMRSEDGRRFEVRVEALEPDGTSADTPPIAFAHGTMRLDDARVAAEIHVALFGRVSGRLRATGAASNPSIDVRVSAANIVPDDAPLWDGTPVSAAAEFVVRDRRAQGRFVLESESERWVTMEGEAPLHVSLVPALAEWPPSGPVSGRVLVEADLGALAPLFLLDVHRLSGRLTADLTVTGSVAHPEANGHIRILNGYYEHERAGVILRNLDVAFSGRDDRIVLERFTADDGDRGRLEWSGFVRLDPAADYPVEARLDLTDFRLFRNDFGEATGNGHLILKGNRRASLLNGALNVSPVVLNIPERAPPFMVDLEVIEIDGESSEEEREPAASWLAEHDAQLDVQVDFRDRVYVRGRGLESEWAGRLVLRGPATDPELSGSLSVVRGRWVFFGKRLSIARGVVTLDGSRPPMPAIDVLAETRSGGILASLRVSGYLDSPETHLESAPPLPEDEILARLLFGREAARITPWQAVTLAQAVHSMRGGGSAFDLMGETRRLLRVDQIDVRDSDDTEGETLVSVGKYIGDRVYVTLEHGVGVEGGRARVEIELTSSLRLETDMGPNADAGLDLGWRWDH